ncbi:alpha-amylase family glycosyl hydrolase [Anaerosporobacter sp.]|uniref:alpha-amylase family glycosyl hydrolase n=1 Tax=Anaerosporobacter sp. TaxID=1872529 RepID=UPI00286F7508|nr:alpha-amylase family glycosyl hydrolase [Anaerosporobacter sp.]
MNNKKRISIVLIICMLVCCSCSSTSSKNTADGNSVDTNSVQDNKTASNGSDAKDDAGLEVNQNDASENTAEDSLDVNNYVEYIYNQELNVIDDIYRTYYEVFLYSYYDSNGDGIGDINGLISKLDYLNDGDDSTDTDLGINGIWLMPMMPSTTYHKYDVIDYYGIDSEYGSLEDFKNLIAECDKRGIKVIIDFVINHTSTQNEWFKSAVKSLGIEPCGQKTCNVEGLCREHNPYCGYYNFAEGKPASGKYYSTGQGDWYYEGVFWDQMPDLNLADANLRTELETIMKYWLDMGVGGFRLDAAKEFYSGNTEKNVEILKWVTDYVKGLNPDNYLVAEVWDSFGTMSQYYASGIDSLFNFPFAQEQGKIVTTLNYTGDNNSGSSFGRAMVTVQDKFRSFNENMIDASFFSNHDTARAAGYFNYKIDKIKMAAGMNLMMAGNSFIYYGEELGMSGSGRDENKRAPMYWSTTDVTGMTAGPKEMETVTHNFGTYEDQVDDPMSLYNYYKRAVRLRNENPEIARGTTQVIDALNQGDIAAITRTYGDSSVAILYNVSEEAANVSLKDSGLNTEGIRGYLSTDGAAVTLEGDIVNMPPYSIVVLK